MCHSGPQKKTMLWWHVSSPKGTLFSILDIRSLVGSEIQQGEARTGLPSLGAAELTSYWPGLLPLHQGRGQREGRKRRLEEPISEAQQPSDSAKSHCFWAQESWIRNTWQIPSQSQVVWEIKANHKQRTFGSHGGSWGWVPAVVLWKGYEGGGGGDSRQT